MKTAVEWLQAEFNKWAEGRVFIPQDILEQAKQMEKEQIMNAYTAGESDGDHYEYASLIYYNETYNQNK